MKGAGKVLRLVAEILNLYFSTLGLLSRLGTGLPAHYFNMLLGKS